MTSFQPNPMRREPKSMIPRLHLPLLILLFAAWAGCKAPLQGMQGNVANTPDLCKRLLSAYQAKDAEAIVKMAPTREVILEMQAASAKAQQLAQPDYRDPGKQKVLDDSVRSHISAFLGQHGETIKELELIKVEQAARMTIESSVMEFWNYILVLRGPKGIFRHQISVLAYDGRLYLGNIGPMEKSEE
jgi:hypothetical protein